MIDLGVEDELVNAAQSDDVRRRLSAVDGFSLMNDRRAFDSQWAALKDPVHEVRIRAASDIVDTGYSFDATSFIEQLGVGTEVHDRAIRETIVELATRDPGGVLKALHATDNIARQVLLIYGLGQSGQYDFVDDLLPFVQDGSMAVRIEAIRALSRLGHPSAGLTVVDALDDEHWEVRSQAALAVGEIGVPEAGSRLQKRLSDESWWVRYRAAEALWRIGDEGRAVLREEAKHPTQSGRIAEWLIAEKEDEAA